jgi:hypothetical protein
LLAILESETRARRASHNLLQTLPRASQLFRRDTPYARADCLILASNESTVMLRALLPRLLVCLLALAASSGVWAQPAPAKNPDDPQSAWRKMTPEQRESAWRQMTPDQKIEAWRRLTPEQRQNIRQNLTPEQRESIRQHMREQRENNGAASGRRLSPEERRQLRDQIYESNRARPPHPGKNNR